MIGLITLSVLNIPRIGSSSRAWSPCGHLLPARERANRELPAGGGLLVADDAEVGEGLELGGELLVWQGVERGLGEVGHGPEANGRIVSAKKGSAQKTEELVGCQAGLANDPPERPDRKVFSLWDDDQTWRIASNDHRSVAPFTTARSIFKSGLSKRGDDLSSL